MSLTPGDTRRLSFELPGDAQTVMGKVEEIETFLHDSGCGMGPAQQVAIVAEEILMNIALNAWGDAGTGHCVVDLSAEQRADGVWVTLRTQDDGVAFDPLAAEAPDLEASLEEREIGGLGIHLIRTMTDQQAYHRTDGQNVLEVGKLCARAAG